MAEVSRVLGVEGAADTRALLDVARDAAHGVARPAAPLTTYLIGLAVARRGGGEETLHQVCAEVSELAARWGESPGAEESAPRPPS